MELLLFLAAVLAADVTPAPLIDGRFDDWADRPVVEEAYGDASSFVDLGAPRWRLDQHGLWLKVEAAQAANLVHATRTLSVALDYAPGGREYRGTPGVDRVLELSPRRGSGQFGGQVLTPSDDTWEVTPVSTIGLRSAPTWSSRSYEMLIRDPLLGTAGTAVHLSLWSQSDEDRVAAFTAVPGPNSPPPAVPSADRAPQADFRLAVWNTGGEDAASRPAEFSSLIRATGADVVLLDEVWPTQQADFLDEYPHQHLGPGGGRQRGMVLSRYPFEPVRAFERLDYPPEALRLVQSEGTGFMRRDLKRAGREGMPAVGVRMEIDGSTLLLVVLDFWCCGSDGSVEDRFRELQAQRIVTAIENTRADEGFDHLIVGGDLNLVGSRRPLNTLLGATEPRLSAVDWLQPNGLTNVTWVRDGNVFPPGRLDFVLHSTGLEALGGIVLNPQVMSDQMRDSLGLKPGLVFRMSGHLPIVTDFRLVH